MISLIGYVPDFLCRKEIDNGSVKLVWEGNNPLKNILYSATRKKRCTGRNSLEKKIFMELE